MLYKQTFPFTHLFMCSSQNIFTVQTDQQGIIVTIARFLFYFIFLHSAGYQEVVILTELAECNIVKVSPYIVSLFRLESRHIFILPI